MNYEQKYNEALEAAQQIYKDMQSGGNYGGMEDLEVIFPELRESEDEIHRKWILEYLYDGLRKSDEQFKDQFKSAIAWFEKQKEQQPVMVQWTGKNLKEVIDFTGKSPKFGEWFKSWEDFENYVHSHDDILKLFCEDGSHYEVPIGAWIVKTPDGYNTPSRFRFIQKPAKWSEEDEKMLIAISKALGCDTAEKILVNGGVTLVMASGFLEALRPSWKPSEEQMKALLNIEGDLRAFQYNDKAKIIAELYEQLRKLM